MKYYTVCIWEPRTTPEGLRTGFGVWMDDFGTTSRAEAEGEIEFAHDDKPRAWVKIITSDGSAADMIEKRAALAAPPRYKLEA